MKITGTDNADGVWYSSRRDERAEQKLARGDLGHLAGLFFHYRVQARHPKKGRTDRRRHTPLRFRRSRNPHPIEARVERNFRFGTGVIPPNLIIDGSAVDGRYAESRDTGCCEDIAMDRRDVVRTGTIRNGRGW